MAIEHVNLISFDIELPTIADVYDHGVRILPELLQLHLESVMDAAGTGLRKSGEVDGAGPSLSEHKPSVRNFLYGVYKSRRDDFLALYEYIATLRDHGGLYWAEPPKVNIELTIKEGEPRTVEFNPVGIAQIFHGIDPDRLRRCTICAKFFWAKRSDSVTCSGSCLNVFRQRKHRAKLQAEKRNEKRRENHVYKRKRAKK